jgi:hypothetical protein
VVNRRGDGSTFGDVVRGNGNHQGSSELNAFQARDVDSNALRNVVQADAERGDKTDATDLTLLFGLRVNDFLRLGSTVSLVVVVFAVFGRCIVVVISFFGLVGAVGVRVTLALVVVTVREEMRGKSEKEHANEEPYIGHNVTNFFLCFRQQIHE